MWSKQHQLMNGLGDIKDKHQKGRLIHQLFEARVEKSPEAVALVFEEETLTYRELDQRANQLAHYLQKQGVKAEVMVGLCIERSLEMVIAILGILKAGGAYVPLDPSNPTDRLTFILEDTQVPLLLTQQQFSEQFLSNQVTLICLDSDWPKIARESVDKAMDRAVSDNLAYVIYTSGSTGKPKGVLVTHYNVVRLFHTTDVLFHFNENDVWTLFHSYAFDFSVWEIWGALFYGGKLIVVPLWVSRSPQDFYELLLKENVTVLNQTPSAFFQLVRVEDALESNRYLSTLRIVIFGGEALDIQNLKPWFERHGDQSPQLVNMYGITETTVHVTYRPLSLSDLNSDSRSIIGKPIPDLTIYLVDKNGDLVSVGEKGEIHVGGPGVARGYFHRPELNVLKFIPDRFSDKSETRLYKTGDLGRMLPNGDIDYLGRIDHQIKIRGFRVELGEIEAALNEHPSIRESVVIVREDISGEIKLVAYFVALEGPSPISALRSIIKAKLPDYMMPSAFVPMKSFPLTENGKLNRNVLPEPNQTRPELEQDYVAPRTDIEKTLSDIWCKIVGIDRAGLYDNFFDIGGNSVLSIKVVQYIEQILKISISIIKVYQYPTIDSLSKYINENQLGHLHQEGNHSRSSYKKAHERAQKQKMAFARQRKFHKRK